MTIIERSKQMQPLPEGSKCTGLNTGHHRTQMGGSTCAVDEYGLAGKCDPTAPRNERKGSDTVFASM